MNKKEVDVDKEDIVWFNKVKKKLAKYISDDRWDMITLPNLAFSIVEHICITEKVEDLSPLINERIIDDIFQIIEKKFKEVKKYIIKNNDEFKM